MPAKLLLTMSLTIVVLFGFLFALLAAVGYFFDLSVYTMVALAVVLVAIQWAVGPEIIRMTTNMRPLGSGEMPWLQDEVRDLCKKNKVPVPKIFIANSGAPNAFTFGRTQGSATLVVTNGLLKMLNKDEVKSVVAHEVGHIKHSDMVVMTIVSVVPMIAYYVYVSLFYARGNERNRGGEAALIGAGAFIVYFVSNLLVLALSRLREYYADRFSGENIRPALLESALMKITYGLSMSRDEARPATRAFMIADPEVAKSELAALSSSYSDMQLSDKELKEAMKWEEKNVFSRIGEIFRTHPLTYKRIKALKEMETEAKA